MSKSNPQHLLFKISLLSISLMLALAQAVSAAFPAMYQAFPQISHATIETLGTIPNFGAMIGLFLSPVLVRHFHAKKIVLTGLTIALLAGTFPMYSHNFNLILGSRFLLGFGLGLFNSLAISLLANFY